MAADTGINPKLPTWDGDWRTFSDYRLACQLERDGLKDDEQITLAPRLARNLTSRAWEACLDIDRSKLRAEGGLDYLLEYLKEKRGRQKVDVLGEALEKYFTSGDAVRQDRENLNDFEQRIAVHFRDIKRALAELGSGTSEVLTEIYGWFLLNKHVRLDASDVATLKAQTASYKLSDVWVALRRMWGGDSLATKDQDRRRTAKAFVATTGEENDDELDPPHVWWEDEAENEASVNDKPGENGRRLGGSLREPNGRVLLGQLPGGEEGLLQGCPEGP